MDPVLNYFSENLAVISKEELLKALENALKSADYWREACLGGSNLKELNLNIVNEER
ncbi:MAG: hypothetical protein ACLP05_11910 [Candidatus Kryptoniota bacterium]